MTNCSHRIFLIAFGVIVAASVPIFVKSAGATQNADADPRAVLIAISSGNHLKLLPRSAGSDPSTVTSVGNAMVCKGLMELPIVSIGYRCTRI